VVFASRFLIFIKAGQRHRPYGFASLYLATEASMMEIQEIRHIARQHGLNPARLDKADPIRAIQKRAGSFDCFARAQRLPAA